jgi:DNA-binding NarL/FixJ family response regulator
VPNEPIPKLRILIADDFDELRRAVVRLLEHTFDIVGSVATGPDLVRAALALRPDVIVSDLQMPGFSGIEAMKTLRSRRQAARFVLLTGAFGNPREWIEAGVLGVVCKTDMHLELVAAVHAVAADRIYLSSTATRSECSG